MNENKIRYFSGQWMLKAQTQTESAENTVFPWAADSAVDEVSPSQPDRGYSEVHPPLKTLQSVKRCNRAL